MRAGTDGWAWGEDGGPGATARGAHKKHSTHGCDAGGVEAQRLIEHLRLLPSREKRAYIRRWAKARAGTDGWVWVGGGRKRHMYGTCTGRAPTKGLGAVHDYGERTLNMLRMVVTPEVSKLSG